MRILWAVGALVLVGSCGEPAKPADKFPTVEDRADALMACSLALMQAERQGDVSGDAKFQTPWRVNEMDEGQSGRRVGCAAYDDKGNLGVVVDVICTDVNDPACHPLVRIVRPS